MEIHRQTIAEAFASLKSGPDSLSTAESVWRLAEFGPNQVEQFQRESLVRLFLKGFIHFFAIILLLAAGLAFVAEWREPGHGMATLGFAIIGGIVINGAFSFWQEVPLRVWLFIVPFALGMLVLEELRKGFMRPSPRKLQQHQSSITTLSHSHEYSHI